MRVLFTTLPATGHFHPLVPLARATAAAGHDIAFASAASFNPTIESVGFPCFPAGFDRRGVPLDVLFPELRSLTGEAFTHFVSGHIRVAVEAAQMVTDLVALTGDWTPDVIVRDASEYGGCTFAEVLGIPHASVRTSVTASSYAGRRFVAQELNILRGAHGLAPDPEATMPFRYLHLACEPPGLWPAEDPPAPTSHLLRPEPFDRSGAESLPSWVKDLPDAPTICATLGTYMNRSAEIFQAILDGIRNERLNVILTIGRDQDPAQFGPQPSNVRIERYIPLSLLLPYCAGVVCQAGFSTTVTALAHGLPMVLIPLGADQPLVAQQMARLGVGPVLDATNRTPEAIRDAVHVMLTDPTYRANAERVHDAMMTLPGPEHGVTLLEKLAIERTPVMAGSERAVRRAIAT